MKKYFAIITLALAAVVLCSCDRDDDFREHRIDKVTKEATTDYVMQAYANARILEIEREHGMIKAEIVHNNIAKDVYFNENIEWLFTEWDVRVSDLPQGVRDSIAQTEYASYRIDDADFIQKPDSEYYVVELEKGNHEVRLSITAAGVIL